MSFNKLVHNFRSTFALRRSLLDILISLEARILRQPPASMPEWPENKRKRFSRQKVTLSYIVSIVFQQMALPICSQGYLIAWEAVVSLPLLVHDILCSFFIRWFFSFFTFSCMCIQSSFNFICFVAM